MLEWEQKLSAGELTIRNKVQSYLDAGHGACHLANDRVALLVQDALLHFDRERYRLLEWVIMPNHVHLIVGMNKGRSLSTLLHGWKSFTSKEANRILGRKGQFWEPEYYDRYIRSETHYFVAVRYLRENPVRAKLCRRPEEWRFSSAYELSK